MDDKNVIRRYVRHPKTGKLDGVLVAGKIDGVVHITAAKVRNNSTDVFNKSVGYNIAKDRLLCASKGRKVKIPASFAGELPSFMDRCKGYFKTENVALPFVDTFQHNAG